MRIHGETEIVLKNVKTGLVERIRSENTFQGQFIAKYLRNVTGQTLNVSNEQSNDQTLWPLWKNVVGGLFLFRDQIEEGTQYMPAGNVMIGAGIHGFTHSGSPTEWGSFNATESSAGLSGITQVYDFTTDQANGEIGCVCLTSKQGARIGYGQNGETYMTRYNMGPQRGTYRWDYPGGFGFKDSSNLEWTLTPRRHYDSSMSNYSQQIAGGKMYFEKRRFGFNKMSVFHDYEKTLEFDLTQIGGNPFSATASTTGSYRAYHLGGSKFGIKANATTTRRGFHFSLIIIAFNILRTLFNRGSGIIGRDAGDRHVSPRLLVGGSLIGRSLIGGRLIRRRLLRGNLGLLLIGTGHKSRGKHRQQHDTDQQDQ